jgi:large subunit ribosomal protein L3
MVSEIYGKKVGSTQIFSSTGAAIPVTAIEAEPCTIVGIKTDKKDGYSALRVSFGSVKEKKVNKPTRGIYEKSKLPFRKHLKELKLIDKEKEYKTGDQIDVSIFKVGDKVKITGISKGKGFSGVIKKYNFHRGPMTHGSHSIRRPGAAGMCATPSKIQKGKKMPGRMGGRTVTVPPTEIIDIITEQNLIMVKGGVPGPSGNIVLLKKV